MTEALAAPEVQHGFLGFLLGGAGLGMNWWQGNRRRKDEQRRWREARDDYERRRKENMKWRREQMKRQEDWVRENRDLELSERKKHRKRSKRSRRAMNLLLNSRYGMPATDFSRVAGYKGIGGRHIPLQRQVSLSAIGPEPNRFMMQPTSGNQGGWGAGYGQMLQTLPQGAWQLPGFLGGGSPPVTQQPGSGYDIATGR